jgi:uncharacterized protein YycO
MADNIDLTPQGGGGMCIGAFALQPADIIVTRASATMSKVIRWGTSSPVSHAMLYVGNDRVVEAIGEGVVERSVFAALDGDNLAVAYRHAGLTGSQAAQIVKFARSKIGAGYDTLGAASAGMTHPVAGWTVVAVGGVGLYLVVLAGGRSDRFFCSELVLQAYKQAGVPLTSMSPSKSSPERIVEATATGQLQYVGHLMTSEAVPAT